MFSTRREPFNIIQSELDWKSCQFNFVLRQGFHKDWKDTFCYVNMLVPVDMARQETGQFYKFINLCDQLFFNLTVLWFKKSKIRVAGFQPGTFWNPCHWSIDSCVSQNFPFPRKTPSLVNDVAVVIGAPSVILKCNPILPLNLRTLSAASFEKVGTVTINDALEILFSYKQGWTANTVVVDFSIPIPERSHS